MPEVNPVATHFQPDRDLYWEHRWLLRSRSFVEDGSVVVDVGANIGNHTVFWLRETRAKRVHAFEPHGPYLIDLDANLARYVSDQSRVTVHSVALGTGEALQYTRNGHFAVADDGLETQTLDSFALSNVSLLKIDTEGAELRVLEGARKLLADSHPFLWIEYHPNRGVSKDDVQSFLTPFGYTLNSDMWLHHNLKGDV